VPAFHIYPSIVQPFGCGRYRARALLIYFALANQSAKLDLFTLTPTQRLRLIGLGVVVSAGLPAWFGWKRARSILG